MKYDVIIVGCGPAGIFAALELAEKTDLSILMLDRGPDINNRRCPATRGIGCVGCNPCDLLAGWGGAGAFSDGKLTLSSDVGGWLGEYISKEKLNDYIKYVDDVYLKFGAQDHLYGVDSDKIEEFERRATKAGLRLVVDKLRHLGTDKCVEITDRMYKALNKRVQVQFDTDVKHIMVEEGRVAGVETAEGKKIQGKYLVVGPGRSGAEWLTGEARALGLRTLGNPVDVGVRVEVPSVIMEELTSVMYEPKFIYYSRSFDDQVRTFCTCPGGEVITESYNDVITVNGQSYAERRTNNTNFAILVSTSFTQPFKEPIAYGKYIARLANLLGRGIIVQRLGDLEVGRRSTPDRIERNVVPPTLRTATPGDLSFVLPYRYITDIKEMLQALDHVTPGICSKTTLLYGVEVKFYSSRLELTGNLETKIKNFFAVGDGAGLTRGLVQASVSGVMVGQEIEKRFKDPSLAALTPQPGS